MARRSETPRSPRTPVPVPTGGATRARLRLGAVLALGLLALGGLMLAIRLYFFPDGSAVASAIVGIGFGVGALAYGLLAWAVVRQSRGWHLVAAVTCAVAAVLAIRAGMAWPDWLILGVNVAAFGLLLGCVPRKAP